MSTKGLASRITKSAQLFFAMLPSSFSKLKYSAGFLVAAFIASKGDKPASTKTAILHVSFARELKSRLEYLCQP